MSSLANSERSCCISAAFDFLKLSTKMLFTTLGLPVLPYLHVLACAPDEEVTKEVKEEEKKEGKGQRKK